MKLFTQFGIGALFLCLTSSVYAQKFEAESGTLSGGAAAVNDASASGGKAVDTQEGSISLPVSLTKTGSYNVYVYAAAPYGEKTNNFIIDNASATFYLANNAAYTKVKVASAMKLNSGAHAVQITKSWGWIRVDYIEFEYVDPSSLFNINTSLVTPNATTEAKCVYQYLYDNYNKKILSGVMTLNSFDESDWLKQNTGKEPVILGIDLMHTNRGYTWFNEQTPVNDAKTWWGKKGIPILTWHWRDPLRKTEGFYWPDGQKPASDVTNFDIKKVSDPSSAEYKAMLNDIDYTASLFKSLQTANVPILWRPLHEAAGGWFWWGRDGASCKALWRLMYDRMVNHHGLKNLIWVWTREPNDESFYPGDDVVDIVGRDIYKTGDHSSQAIEFNNMNSLYGGKKMVTISECGSFPDVDNLIADAAGWSWFMTWYGDFTRSSTYNSLDLWKKMVASSYVITLDEMPSLKTCTVTTDLEENTLENAELIAYPSLVSDILTIKGPEKIQTIEVFTVVGSLIKQQSASASEATVSFLGLPSGAYVVKINGNQTVKIIKD